MEDWVALSCHGGTLEALASRLTHYGPAGGEPRWLVSGVWLCTADAQYLATASAEVLPDGHVARPLNIYPPQDVLNGLAADLPDVAARVSARGSAIDLASPPESLQPPITLSDWRANAYSLHVLVRVTEHAATVNRVACALLFQDARDRSLLVGTDISSLAMVYSEDPALIERYRTGCEALTVDEYRALERR